jgi:hypothetical protein
LIRGYTELGLFLPAKQIKETHVDQVEVEEREVGKHDQTAPKWLHPDYIDAVTSRRKMLLH